MLGVALVSCCGAPAAADHTNSWRLLLVAGSASHATTSPAAIVGRRARPRTRGGWSRSSAALCPRSQLEAADAAAHALVEDHGHAVGPRVDAAQERLRAGERGHVPRRVGRSGRAQRHEGGAERGDASPWSWPWNVAVAPQGDGRGAMGSGWRPREDLHRARALRRRAARRVVEDDARPEVHDERVDDVEGGVLPHDVERLVRDGQRHILRGVERVPTNGPSVGTPCTLSPV